MRAAERPAGAPRKPIQAGIATILGVTALYSLSACLGLLPVLTPFKNVSPIWPPSGVAIGLLLLAGMRVWPGIALGAFIANYATGLPPATAAMIAVGNTLEGLVAAYLLGRMPWFHRDLGRVKDVLLLVAASTLSTVPAASIGAASLFGAGVITWQATVPAWLTWWLGDSMGVLVVGAAIMIWAAPAPHRDAADGGQRILESAALAVGVVGVTAFVFGPGKEFPYAIFPVLILTALRLGQRGGAAAVVAVSCISVYATVHHLGPFVQQDPRHGLVHLQTFMAVVSLTTLLMGAAISERAQAESALRKAEHRFRLALENTDISVYSQDLALRYTWIYDGKHRFDPARVIGRTDAELASPEEAARLTAIKKRVLQTGIGEHHEVVATTQGRTSAYDLAVEPLRDLEGRVIGVSGVAHDITELMRYQHDVEALNERLRRAMRETHHRVKNNLQIIAAMVDMRLMDGEEQIPSHEVRRLSTLTSALATVHDLLTHEARNGGNATTVSAEAMVQELATMLRATALGRQLELEVDDLRLPTKQATSLAIVICELVGNAVKHGQGAISVSLTQDGAGALLQIRDGGSGFPADFDLQTSCGTGLELVESLSRTDLAGDMRWFNSDGGGACVAVSLRNVGSTHAVLEKIEKEGMVR